MKTTLKDIATVLGVSKNTVSRALNDKSDIGEDTKKRICETARLMGYVPNSLAKGLTSQKTNIIGLAVTEGKNPFRNQMIATLRETLMSHGYHLIVTSIDYESPAENIKSIRELIGRRIDGLIVGSIDGILAEHPLWEAMLDAVRLEMPLVVFDTVQTSRVSNIKIDYKRNAQLLVEHLVSLGYRKIVSFDTHPEKKRVKGYVEAMKHYGLAEYVNLIKVDFPTLRNGYLNAKKFIKDHSGDLPEVIMARNDLHAIGIIAGLKEMGIKVPQQIAVTGYDNIEIGEMIDPPLTTVGIDIAEFTTALFEILDKQIKHGIEGNIVCREIEGHLVVRQSCGCNLK